MVIGPTKISHPPKETIGPQPIIGVVATIGHIFVFFCTYAYSNLQAYINSLL